MTCTVWELARALILQWQKNQSLSNWTMSITLLIIPLTNASSSTKADDDLWWVGRQRTGTPPPAEAETYRIQCKTRTRAIPPRAQYGGERDWSSTS